MTWAHKRQLTILFFLTLLGLGILAILIVPYFTKPPTCFDKKQNGTERGTDCGGSCKLLCTADMLPLSVVWARSVPVNASLYNAVALVQNPNRGAGIREMTYEFSLYDKDNLFIISREGKTYINPNGEMAIFEASLPVGVRVPKYTSFEFKNPPRWERVDSRATDVLLSADAIVLENEETKPKVSAVIKNNSLYTIDDVSATALLFDVDGTLMGASKTLVEELPGGTSEPIFFTWPASFQNPIALSQVFPTSNVFTTVFD